MHTFVHNYMHTNILFIMLYISNKMDHQRRVKNKLLFAKVLHVTIWIIHFSSPSIDYYRSYFFNLSPVHLLVFRLLRIRTLLLAKGDVR